MGINFSGDVIHAMIRNANFGDALLTHSIEFLIEDLKFGDKNTYMYVYTCRER